MAAKYTFTILVLNIPKSYLSLAHLRWIAAYIVSFTKQILVGNLKPERTIYSLLVALANGYFPSVVLGFMGGCDSWKITSYQKWKENEYKAIRKSRILLEKEMMSIRSLCVLWNWKQTYKHDVRHYVSPTRPKYLLYYHKKSASGRSTLFSWGHC